MSRNVQSLERGIAVLEILVKQGPSGVTEVANKLELDKTIVYRLLSTLQDLGYVRQDENRKYLVGPKLRIIGGRVLSSLDLRTLARPYMQQLAEITGGVSHLAKFVESRAIYIERVQHPEFSISSTDVGGESPGYCSAAGKVLWAYLPQIQLHNLLNSVQFHQHTSNTITDKFTLQHHLAEVYERGYAIDREEHRVGLIGVGVAVQDYTGQVIASICVARQASRANETVLEQTCELVIDVARRLSAELGYSSNGF
jgi:IclR family transcriptional regulator, KDG regulon repressor